MFMNQERINQSYVRYCSGKQVKYFRTTTMVHLKCDNCGIEFTKQKGKGIDRRRCNNEVNHFCSNCPTYSLAGAKGRITRRKNNLNRVGERTITENGYVRIYVADTYIHPKSVYGGSIFEHTMVMEQHLNRPLQKREVVHHIDGNRRNNSIDNLDNMTVEEHNNCHGKTNRLLFELFKERIIVYNRDSKLYERLNSNTLHATISFQKGDSIT